MIFLGFMRVFLEKWEFGGGLTKKSRKVRGQSERGEVMKIWKNREKRGFKGGGVDNHKNRRVVLVEAGIFDKKMGEGGGNKGF